MEAFNNLIKQYKIASEETSETNRRASFLTSFQISLGVSEQDLTQSVISKMNTRLMDSIMQIDYGLQKKWIDIEEIFEDDEEFFPVLFAVAAVSSHYKVRTVLICDELNLSYIHSGHLAVVVEPLEILRDDLVFTLSGDGILRACSVRDSDKFKGFLDRLPNYCTVNLDDSAFDGNYWSKDESEDHEAYIDGERAPIHYDSYDDEVPKTKSLRINEYIRKYTDEKGRPTNEAYNNDHRIDFTHSDFRADQFETVEFSRTIDIDGFFAVVEPKDLASCINSFGTMIAATEPTKIGTVESIAKLARDANIPEFEKVRPVQIAYLDGNKQFELYTCFTFDKTSSDTVRKGLNLVEIVEDAHQYAKTFPCDEDCLFEKEHKSLSCSNAMKLSQVKVRQFTRDYSLNSFKCLINNMNILIGTKLEPFKGIKFFYLIRTIGTKNRYISAKASGIHRLLTEMLSCLNIHKFNTLNGPRAFVDISVKFVPYTRSGTEKVSVFY